MEIRSRFRRPFLWFSQIITGVPRPWKHFLIDGLMVNAYDILRRPKVCSKVLEMNVHRFLDFSGLIMMDSGGFLFMKQESLKIHPKDILELYRKSKPNFGVILDYPLNPNLSSNEVKRRQKVTLKNTEYMIKNFDESNPELIPVIHGYSSHSIRWFLNELFRIGNFKIYAIGSLVPSVFSQRGARRLYNVIRLVTYVRRKLPDKIIHVFGVGSTLTMHLMFYLGVDSVDSSGWRKKAAYGAIQLPGIGDRYITRKKKSKNYPDLSVEERKILDACKCPVCKEHSLEDLMHSFKLRALHNAWVHQNEVENARKLIKEGIEEYEKYIKKIFEKTIFNKFFKYAMKMRRRRGMKLLNHSI